MSFRPEKIFTYFRNPPPKSLVCIISSYASRENYFQQYTLSLHQGFLQQYYSTKTFVVASCDLFLFKLSYLKDWIKRENQIIFSLSQATDYFLIFNIWKLTFKVIILHFPKHREFSLQLKKVLPGKTVIINQTHWTLLSEGETKLKWNELTINILLERTLKL